MSDLITAEHFRAWRAIEGAAVAQLELAISTASEYVTGRLGRDPLTTAHTEWLDGDGTKLLYTTYWPITTVSSLTVDTVTWTVREPTEAEAYQYAQLPAHGKWLKARGDHVWTAGEGNVLITYTAGLGESTDELPYDLRMTVIMLTDLWLKETERLGYSARTIGSERVESIARNLDVYPLIQATIKRYSVR